MYASLIFIGRPAATGLFVGISGGLFTSVRFKTGILFGGLTYLISVAAAKVFNPYMPSRHRSKFVKTATVINLELSGLSAKVILTAAGYPLTVRQAHQVLGSVGVSYILCRGGYSLYQNARGRLSSPGSP